MGFQFSFLKNEHIFIKNQLGTSMTVQQLRLHFSMQRNVGMIPGQGSKIPHVLGTKNQHIKQKQYCNKFNKGFKMVFIKKIFKRKNQWYSK